MIAASVGDCEAALRASEITSMCDKHNLDVPSEKERIEKADGGSE